jgi:hypothetical protein
MILQKVETLTLQELTWTTTNKRLTFTYQYTRDFSFEETIFSKFKPSALNITKTVRFQCFRDLKIEVNNITAKLPGKLADDVYFHYSVSNYYSSTS